MFAAVFAPAIQNKMNRRKANALFSLAYLHDLIKANSSLESFDQLNPIWGSSPQGRLFDDRLRNSQEARNAYANEMRNAIGRFALREVDLTKWPAVDLGLAADISLAIEAVKSVQTAAIALTLVPVEKFYLVAATLRAGIDAAKIALARAEASGEQSAKWLADSRNRAASCK